MIHKRGDVAQFTKRGTSVIILRFVKINSLLQLQNQIWIRAIYTIKRQIIL